MTCFSPIQAFQTDSGDVVFSERGSIARSLQLSCGRCIGCRMARSRSWAIRCVHESQMHALSSFVTLTYKSLPAGFWCDRCESFINSGSLHYCDYQLFMKRLRKWFGPVRFFACGEYGDESLRPHFHALLFGCHFSDRKRFSSTLYKSDKLSELWPHGFASIGDVTFQSAAYCARYACKKISGPMAEDHYRRVDVNTGEFVSVVPEFARMSLRPGIGYSWFLKYWREVYEARDGVVLNGKTLPAPKFYDNLLERTMPDIKEAKEFSRYLKSRDFAADCTPERLLVRETVARAQINQWSSQL